MSPYISISWNPIDNTGSINFMIKKYINVDGILRTDIPPSDGGHINRHISDVLNVRYVPEGLPNGRGLDPVTGADLSQISVAGVMAIIKSAFEVMYIEDQLPIE